MVVILTVRPNDRNVKIFVRDARQPNQSGIGMVGIKPLTSIVGPLIRVLDDDESLRDAIAQLLESVDLDVRTFSSVADFLDNDDRERSGCLILDIRLPGMSGLELQGRMADLGISLPVIMVTGHGDIPMSVQAMKAGAVDFLTKPFREQALLDAV